MHSFKAGSATVFLIFGSLLLTLAVPSSGTAVTRIQKSFDNWIVTCVETEETQRCALSQTRVGARDRRPVFTWSIARDETENGLVNLLTVPSGVTIPDGITFSIGNEQAVQVPYTICGPRSCLGRLVLDQGTLRQMHSAESIAISFVRGNKAVQQAKIELQGFADAYAYFVEQLR